MGTHVPKLNKGLPFAPKQVDINVSTAAKKLALLPKRTYNGDVK